MKKLKILLSSMMVFVLGLFNIMPSMVSALSYDLTNNGSDRNKYNITSDVVTLYVGNISVNGTSDLKYLYTDESVNTETLTEIRKILTPDYASLLPTTAGQIKVSNKAGVNVSDLYKDAGVIAAALYPDATGIENTSSTILYNQNEFNSLVTASQTEVSDEKTAEANNLSAYNARKTTFETNEQSKYEQAVAQGLTYDPQDFTEEYVKLFNDSTTYPNLADKYFIADNSELSRVTYAVVDSVITKITIYNLNRTIIKVVNTSANVTTPVVTSTKINEINVDVTANEVGTKIVDENTKPIITLGDNANYNVSWTMYIDNLPSKDATYDSGAIFGTTIEEDKDYFVEIYLSAKDGYIFDNTDNITLKVNGGADYELGYCSDNQVSIFTKVKAPTKSSSEEEKTTISAKYEYIEGANQKYTINENDTLTFRINADYSLFENGGKVYVDDKLVDSKNYSSKSGSTIITFTKEYMSALSVGEHTLKVLFNNGGNATTKFTIVKEETKVTDDNNKTTPSTDKKTNNTKNPSTGDGVTTTIMLLALSIVGLIITGTYGLKKKFVKID